ncbi:hypothetical protein N9O56_02245 [Rickettsiales bacterium]|nr:hypothetical protein [Rickettsiales bacterium]
MGTWALPQSLEKAKKLQNLLKKPLIALDAESKLYDLLGDDDLFDSIIEEQRVFGDDLDVRDLVKFSLEYFLKNYKNATNPWDKEAFKICQNICK